MTCNPILLDWGEGDSKVELQNITFFHLMKFFCKVQRSIMSPLAIAGMNNTPKGSRTLGEFFHLCRLLTLLLFFLSSGKRMDPLSVVSCTVHVSIASRQKRPNLHRSVLGPIIIIPNVLETQ